LIRSSFDFFKFFYIIKMALLGGERMVGEKERKELEKWGNKKLNYLRMAILVALPIAILVLKLPLWCFLLLPLIFLRFTLVQEGTAKIVVRFKGFKKCLMRWEGYEFDNEWNVRPIAEVGKKLHLPGGFRFVGFWPMDEVYKYKFRWTDIEIKEGKEVIDHHEKEIDYILVRPHEYIGVLPEIETKDRIPSITTWIFLIRVINPYKALFVAPINWLEKVQARVNPILRSYVASQEYVTLLAVKEASIDLIKLSEELKKEKENISKEWGIEIVFIRLREVEAAPKYKEAVARQTEQKYSALGRAERIMRTIINAVVIGTGKSEQEVQSEFLKNPEEFYRKHRALINNVMSTIAMEEDAYLRIETPGAGPIEGALLRLISAWKRMPKGEQRTERPQRKKRKGGPFGTEGY